MEENEKPRTKRQIATQDRRRHIVEAAAICFVEHGFHQSSMRDIAKRAEISVGNLYNHFESKTQLIAEIAGLEADDLMQIHGILAQDGSGPDVIDAFVIAYFEYVSRPENAVLTAEITAEAMRSPQIVDTFSENRQRTINGIIEVLEADAFSFPERREEMAEMLLGLTESAAGRVAFGTEQAKVLTLSDLRSIVSRLLSFKALI